MCWWANTTSQRLIVDHGWSSVCSWRAHTPLPWTMPQTVLEYQLVCIMQALVLQESFVEYSCVSVQRHICVVLTLFSEEQGWVAHRVLIVLLSLVRRSNVCESALQARQISNMLSLSMDFTFSHLSHAVLLEFIALGSWQIQASVLHGSDSCISCIHFPLRINGALVVGGAWALT